VAVAETPSAAPPAPIENGTGDFDIDASLDPGTAETILEIQPLDRYNQAISAQLAFFQGPVQNDASGPPYYSAMGIRYSRTVARKLLFRSKLQDSFTLEGGRCLYGLTNYLVSGDTYNVMPLLATGRYNVFFNDTFGAYFYGGFGRSLVIGSTAATDEGLASLESFIPAAGAGLLFHLGPHWSARVEGGVDMIGAGLMIGF
jgi:hypothetical protein